jgi:DNA-directed RNA polymerase subunit RPC12/RpoP
MILPRESEIIESGMVINFSCDNCGKQFRGDERSQGKRGRCLHCGHIMRIPRVEVFEPAHAPVAATAPAADAAPPVTTEADPAFRLSPPSAPPAFRQEIVAPAGEPAPHHPEAPHPVGPHPSVFHLASSALHEQQHADVAHAQFELLDDDADPAAVVPISPAIKRGLQEIEEFQKDRRGYQLVGEKSGLFSLFRLRQSGRANWLYVRWRAAVGVVLRLLRWVDTWAYLISVPFIILMIFGIVVENRGFVHMGAVVVVLANYGRFWADLLAFFVRPYKDGPLQGLAFLFPPYTIYFLTTRWKYMKPILKRIAGSCIPIVLVVLAYAFLPSVNPDIDQAAGVEAKIESGKAELDREINVGVEQVEKSLIEVGKHAKSVPGPRR